MDKIQERSISSVSFGSDNILTIPFGRGEKQLNFAIPQPQLLNLGGVHMKVEMRSDLPGDFICHSHVFPFTSVRFITEETPSGLSGKDYLFRSKEGEVTINLERLYQLAKYYTAGENLLDAKGKERPWAAWVKGVYGRHDGLNP